MTPIVPSVKRAPAVAKGERLAVMGAVVNVGLAVVKLVAGVLGNSYALIADAIESFGDLLGSAVIWGGLRIGSRPVSPEHPYGYGKAESIASLFVGLLILIAGVAIGVEAVREIITPHHLPEAFTLIVLVVVVAVKEMMFRIVRNAARQGGSPAVEMDAWHHRADALTSVFAFVGIGVALATGWPPADDLAALLASGVIVFNAVRLIVRPLRELLDAQDERLAARAAATASKVLGVRRVQKVFTRRSGTRAWVDMHIWVDGGMSVHEAHALSHAVKQRVMADHPEVGDVLIHIEPDAERGYANEPRSNPPTTSAERTRPFAPRP